MLNAQQVSVNNFVMHLQERNSEIFSKNFSILNFFQNKFLGNFSISWRIKL